jgi:hypothetical protein
LISYNRNTDVGIWDYPIPGVGSEAWPNAEFSEKNCDWKMWLGPARKRPLSAERYFRWRKYWDYSGEYYINMISCMGNQESAPISIYGNWGTLQIVQERMQAGDAMGDQARPRGGRPGREIAVIKAERTFLNKFKEANDGKTEVTIEPVENEDLADNWLNSMRSREKPAYDSLKGYQVMAAIKLGVESYREGRVMTFDPGSRRLVAKVLERKVYLPPGA